MADKDEEIAKLKARVAELEGTGERRSLSMSACLPVCLPVRVRMRACACVCMYLPGYLSLPACLPVWLSLTVSLFLSLSLPARLASWLAISRCRSLSPSRCQMRLATPPSGESTRSVPLHSLFGSL